MLIKLTTTLEYQVDTIKSSSVSTSIGIVHVRALCPMLLLHVPHRRSLTSVLFARLLPDSLFAMAMTAITLHSKSNFASYTTSTYISCVATT